LSKKPRAAGKKIGTVSPAQAENAAMLGRALGHPLRVQILLCLIGRSDSATGIASLLEVPLGNVSYHLNEVLDRECGIVEVETQRQVRGAFETIYRFDPARLLSQVSWPAIPESLRAGLRGVSLAAFLSEAVAALQSGAVDTCPDAQTTWSASRVDDVGWDAIRSAILEAEERIGVAVKESAGRIESKEGIAIVTGLAAFPAAPLEIKRVPSNAKKSSP
jgi:DNA-binding transcriptional ArsR family regulator